MFATRRRSQGLDIWPGFVDALAAVLMVIIFVLMTFVVAHLYLTNAVNDRDLTLGKMAEQVEALSQNLKTERLSREEAQKALAALEIRIASLAEQLTLTSQNLAAEKIAKSQEIEKSVSLTQKLDELQAMISRLTAALETGQDMLKDKEGQIATLSQRLEEGLAKKLAQIEALKRELEDISLENGALKERVSTLSRQALDKRGRGSLGQFRSDFLTKLAKVLGDRQDIRVVGDRFVFQSEVLFDQGSANLGKAGHAQLDKLAKALKEISQKIPPSVAWVLRVDGHTDTLPISRPQFPSNWELSSARAIAVVRYLTLQGIDPKNLVAAGFGEFQPLDLQASGFKADGKADTITTEKLRARNRRIEFRLDQR